MKSETLSLKTVINKMVLLRKTLLFKKILEKKNVALQTNY